MQENRELNIEDMYKPLIQQRQFHSSKAKYRLYGGAVGGGKMQVLHADICTPFGFRKMGDLQIGDTISSPSGGTTRVIGIYPKGKMEVFRVRFADGGETLAGGEHLWKYSVAGKGRWRKSGLEWKIATTDQIITMMQDGRRILIPTTKPVRFTRQYRYNYRTIPAYTLGVLLGDGHIGDKTITITSADPEITNRVAQETNTSLSMYDGKDHCPSYSFVKEKKKELIHSLVNLGLYEKRSWEKFIPEQYKYSKTSDRLELLMGLMDTDGYCSADGKAYFSSTSKQLAQDVRWLVLSLGGRATITNKIPMYTYKGEKKDGKRAYTVYIRMQDNADIFSLSRKKDLAGKYNGGGKTLKRRIVSIESAGKEECQCIRVDRPDGLYITDDFIVTHNTYAIIWEAILRCLKYDFPITGAIFRQSFPELDSTIIRTMREILPEWFYNYNQSQHIMTFVTGDIIEFCYAETDGDVTRYNSREWDFLSIDELTHFSEYRYTYLNSRVRTTKPIQTKFFAGTNPGNIGHCLTGGDVLTKDGWTPIQNVHIGDEVATDIDGITCYLPVSQVFDEFYSGTIYKSSCNSARFECTPDHLIPIVTETKNKAGRVFHKPKHRMVKDFAEVTRLPEVGSWIGNNPKTFRVPLIETRKLRLNQPTEINFGDYCELMGWFLSEGCICKTQCRFEISQEKKDNREKIRELLDKIGFEYRESGSSFVVFSPHWYAYLSQFGKSREKFVPREILFSDNTCLNRFLGAAMLGDGHGNHYYTVSRRLADDMCEIGLKTGKRVYLSSRQRKNRNGLSYDVSLKENKIAWVEKKRISQENFKGRVYCLGIPGVHRFYVRQNGTVFLSGNSWVKSRWIDKDCSEPGYNPEEYDFIPSKVQDNIYLMEANPDYVSRLKMLPMTEQRALLYGDWDVFEGQFFNEWDLNRHTVKPFTPPSSWQYILGWDDGTREPRSVHLYAVDNDRRVWCVWEYYRKGESLSDAARNIRDELQKLNYWDLIFKLVVDPSMRRKNDQTGLSSIEVLESMGFGFKLGRIEEGNNDRLEGWRVMKSYLSHKPYEEPMLKFFQNCANIIRTIPQMVYYQTSKGDAKKDDLDTSQEDHSADECRYVLMSLEGLPGRFSAPSSQKIYRRGYTPHTTNL